ncbi:hypothetical protein SAMN05216338_101325 [Bradyrhizobium sp. Rc2d]|uniref:hypothetical protein n=1 Tax=Bradyrhizobium sp. Rc2d TaxID=1855321 RepID=UPI00088BC0B2|nr:hypothetical protein [Bradyrhizobium sp. Rc2d]SDH76889.1 hypothetical protein SAMN05216338_101325 [Bradyrhizobium sp. Rc2d]
MVKHTHCYLCAKPLTDPLSVDHVPPLLFFPKEMRRKYNIDKLLTVPVHAACNLAYQFDEEYFVHTLLPMTRGSEAGNAHHFRIRDKLRKGKNAALVNKVLEEFTHKVRGVYLPPTRVAKLIDHGRFFRVLWKIIRGLHYHHTREILPEEWGMRY